MSDLTATRDHALTMAGRSTTSAADAALWLQIAEDLRVVDALRGMFEVAPLDWWQFVPCATCNAERQHPCVKGGGSWPNPSRRPHAARVRSARVLHGTLWLLTNGFEADVLGGAS